MPDKPLTVITYAATASLAAVALVFLFSPNYLIDGDASTSSASTRKKGIVGLSNPANDCFINCILQSLAGLGDLRVYLIRELHRRELGGSEVYAVVPLKDAKGKEVDVRKVSSLQSGEVTQGLKNILDSLNERPIYKKTISAQNFIKVLENAFGTRISKSQQDAQELLQIVAERLREEYHAGRDARERSKRTSLGGKAVVVATRPGLGLSNVEETAIERSGSVEMQTSTNAFTAVDSELNDSPDRCTEEEDGFPLEGETKALIECQYCHFMPKANPTNFVMLNLMVPHTSSTTLNDCFDAHFKTEYIEDYKCDKCRLEHAVEVFSKKLNQAKSQEQRIVLQSDLEKIERALQEDPEKPPKGVELPDIKLAPKRRIARHVRVTSFPKLLVIHLSRSIYDPRSSSTKNGAKISFPEKLPLGGILNRRDYKLLGMVTHKGTHNSGHYESFRRQHLYAPYSRPHISGPSGPYSLSGTPNLSIMSSPKILADPNPPTQGMGNLDLSHITAGRPSISTVSPSPSISSVSVSSPSTRPSSGSTSGVTLPKSPRTSVPRTVPLSEDARIPCPSPTRSTSLRRASAVPSKCQSTIDMSRFKRKKSTNDRWWRISDDKIKECKTSDVLGMQRDVYLLFYEMDKDQ